MGNNVIPRQTGDAYQAKIFWLKACRLYLKNHNAVKVGWEVDSTFGFDDVVLYYSPARLDNKGEEVTEDYYQVKYHVDFTQGFKSESLIDPKFIGAKNESILQRLYKLYRKEDHNYHKGRYNIINTWGLDYSDDFGKLIANDGSIQMKTLFDGSTDSSKMGRIRKAWREHIGVQSDDELKIILSPLRILHSYDSYERLVTNLNVHLQLANLKTIDAGSRSSQYVDLIQKLHSEGKNFFTKDELDEILKREGLIEEREKVLTEEISVGLRSFRKGAESLEIEVENMLCLLHMFSGRFILDGLSWEQDLKPLVTEFSAQLLASKKPLTIHLDTHLSLALYLGYCLDFKSGASIAIVQKTISGKLNWKPQLGSLNETEGDCWSFEDLMQGDSESKDLVLIISVTRDIGSEAAEYAQLHLPKGFTTIHASINPKPSAYSLRDANHAIVALQELLQHIQTKNRGKNRKRQIHLFLASPNAFAFFLGQQIKPLGHVTLYEYDLEYSITGTYHPSLTIS